MRNFNGIPRPEFTPDKISALHPDEVFVFGSNLAGMHGRGAAYYALKHFSGIKHFGAVMGCGGVSLRPCVLAHLCPCALASTPSHLSLSLAFPPRLTAPSQPLSLPHRPHLSPLL